MAEIHIVGNSVKIPRKESLSRHSNEYSILFVGKMSYEPNIVAVRYFSKEIFPQLKKYHPEVKFFIVGANPVKEVIELSSNPDIIVTGFVDSIEPYFQQATIVVAPMLTGAGIQNKIIQAMSYGCCVATSPIGEEGLIIKNDEIAILKSTKEWINFMLEALKNRKLRMEMGERALNYVKKNLSRDVVSKQFWKFMEG